MTDKNKLQTLINQFSGGDLRTNALALFKELGYQSPRTFDKPVAEILRGFDHEKALCSEWINAPFLFQLAEDNLSHVQSLLTDVDGTIIHSYLFVAIELKNKHGKDYSRSDLVKITRELNKSPLNGQSPPVLILFKHNGNLTLSVIHRRLNKKDRDKDVLEKVTLLKDIHINKPHSAHVAILEELAFDNLNLKADANFVDLHNAWQAILDTKMLNKQFYKELSQWYFWAIDEVYFPDAEQIESVKGSVFADSKKVREHNAKNLIRLLTRLLFVWFIKEKNLIPENLFNEDWIKSQLNDFKPQISDTVKANTSHYYRAILQNLFFASLNRVVKERKFCSPNNQKDTTLMHYQSYFNDSEVFLDLVKNIVPFMNGGLFDCLDKYVLDAEGNPCGDAIVCEDSFSDDSNNQLDVPDYIFFGSYKNVDLSDDLGAKNKAVEVRGLIDILKSYKFTITENTPVEEDIALDPELLGQVFENLLASYTPETKTTARKQTGSFYTPREIVDYMVDESLKAYFKSKLESLNASNLLGDHDLVGISRKTDLFERLEDLFSYTKATPEFSATEKTTLIKAIDTCQILDPACGSGAFPMGVLHKLVFVLTKIDPHNILWKKRQIDRVQDFKLQKRIIETFTDNEVNYSRKLYLIENCIYGVDIQPIAIQISKLRFFISLIVDQRIDRDKPDKNFGVLPLPNLETKFVAANTLIGIENSKSQIDLFHNKDVEILKKDLKEIRHKLFSARNPSKKQKYRDEDKELRKEIVTLLEQHGGENNTVQQLLSWNSYDQNASASFFDVEWMFGESGFDIVIGNPPYIKEYTNKAAFDGLRDSPYYQGKMDLWYLFVCKNLEITKKNTGILTFIATNNWTTNTGASKMRSKVLKETTIEKLLDFGSYMIFESADIQTSVMMFRNDNSNDNYTFDFRRLVGDKLTFNDALDLITKTKSPKNEFLSAKISKNDLDGKSLTFSNNALDNVLSKIQKKSNLHLTKNEVANGIHPHYDYVSKATQSVLGDNFEVGQGIFVLSEKERVDLNLNGKELELIKPYFTTEQLRKWCGKKENKEWIIYTGSTFKDAANIEPYPNIKKHLDQFQSVITSDNKPYGLHRARNEYFFQGEKIIALRKCVGEPIFTYTDFDCYVSATFYVIKSERIDLKYLTAVLNSKLVAFWLKNKGKMQGQNYQLDKEPLLDIPVYKSDENQQQLVSRLVDYILFIKQQPFYTSADLDFAEERLMSNFFENLIDALVYELYFPEELHEAKKQFMSLVVQENLPDLDVIEGDKVSALKQIVRRLTDKNHPLYNNLFFLDSVPVVRIIEGKA
jgi:hypothetical protein